jgi:MFS family permease
MATSATETVAASKRATTQLGGGFAWLVWSLAVIFVVYLFSVQTGYAIVNSSVQKDVGLTVVQVATIAATYTWVFALAQFYGGALLDQLGSRKVLPISIALVVIGVFIFANARSFEMLLLSQFVLAVGSCTGFVGAGYIGGQWFGMAKFSVMFGLVQVVAALTSAFSQNALDFALKQTGWRELFNWVGVFGIGLFVLGAIFIRNPAPVPAPASKGVVDFFVAVTRNLVEVAKIGHVWVASISGALLFGVLLALGVVWAPKLLMIRGASESTAVLGSSLIWLGLAVGSFVIPWWSDQIRRRKRPIVLGSVVQFLALAILVYVPGLGTGIDLALAFIFGLANASHMLAFSTAADVVEPRQIGTSAAIVNGIMFIVGGIMISRPGVRVDRAIERGIEKGTMDLLQYAAVPLILALAIAVVVGFAMKETYPKQQAAS